MVFFINKLGRRKFLFHPKKHSSQVFLVDVLLLNSKYVYLEVDLWP